MKYRLWIGCVILISTIFSCVFKMCSSKTPLLLSSYAQEFLNVNGYNDCYIIRMRDLARVQHEKIMLQVTQDEICDYIELELQENSYRREIVHRSRVENKDLAICDYQIMDGSQVVKRVEEAPIRVGTGYYDIFLENSILGLEVGKEHIIPWVVSEEFENKEWAGKQLYIHLSIKSLYEVLIPSAEEYALQKGYASVQEYEHFVRRLILADKREQLLSETEEKIFEKIIQQSVFKIDDDVVANNAVQYYYEYEKIAGVYDVPVEQVVNEQVKADGDIYNLCYNQSLFEIERYLIIGRYAYEKNIVVSNKDIETYCKNKNISSEDLSEEALTNIQYQLIEQKVLEDIRQQYISVVLL